MQLDWQSQEKRFGTDMDDQIESSNVFKDLK